MQTTKSNVTCAVVVERIIRNITF